MTPQDALLDRLRDRASLAAPLLRDETLAQVQATLDFQLPPLLVHLWQEIGNGGFGPGYGLLGLGDGAADDQNQTADKRYSGFRAPDPATPTWLWPQGLWPLVHQGCGIYDCLDCKRDRVLIWEPNAWDEDLPLETALFDAGLSLQDWLTRWAEGEEMFLLMDPKTPGDYALPRLMPLPA